MAAERRRQTWQISAGCVLKRLQTLLDLSFHSGAVFDTYVIIRGFIAPGARFSSICLEQFVEESRYSHYLT